MTAAGTGDDSGRTAREDGRRKTGWRRRAACGPCGEESGQGDKGVPGARMANGPVRDAGTMDSCGRERRRPRERRSTRGRLPKVGDTVVLDGEHLTRDEVVAVARHGVRVVLSDAARANVDATRRLVDRLVATGARVYGVTTGFGALSDVSIPPADTRRLPENLIRSHATAVGDPLPPDAVRATILLRANSLAKGYSGVRPELIEALLAFLNEQIAPVIPCQGSLGASGDLAPLAHLGLVLIGAGEADVDGRRLPGADALALKDIAPLRLEAKEALALINGTPVMTALGVLGLHDAEMTLDAMEGGVALTMEAIRARTAPLAPELQAARPHPGQIAVAARLRQLLGGSANLALGSDRAHVQDPYSVRCAPQVLGPCFEALAYVKRVLEIEINSATDNPLCFPDEDAVISGGNFHGHPVALALDFLKTALASAANMTERRAYLLLDPHLSGLPPCLSPDPGLDSGLMITQYVAASLVGDNKILAHPASVDSIAAAGGIEDYNSLGTHAARNLTRVVENALKIEAVELLCAAQALDLRRAAGDLDR